MSRLVRLLASILRVRRRGPLVVVGAILVAAALSGPVLASYAVTTDNANDSFAAGTVSLTDDDGDSALFTVAAAAAGDSGQRCVQVTYGGSLDAAVKLYAASGGGPLGPYVQITVQQGTGTQANCGDFASSSTLVSSQTVTDLVAANTSFGSGLGTWTPSGGSGAVRTFRVAWSLPVLPDAARGSLATLALQWEARSA